MAVRHVLLMTNELATVTAVSTALESNGKLDPSDVCRDLGAVAARLDQDTIPAVLVDIDEQPHQMLAAIESLARRFPETRFVVVSGQLHSDLLLEAMQAGARHFMVKPSLVSDLSSVLRRLCPERGHERDGGAITILSTGGGCGATTVAINLAVELSRSCGAPDPSSSLVVDFDHCYGAVGTYLGVDADYGVLDLLDRQGPLDAQLITSSAVTQTGHPAALLSTARNRLGEAVSIDPRRIAPMVNACKAAYLWTVIDAPRVPLNVAAQLAANSDTTLLLMQLTIKDIRVARQMLNGLLERGLSASSVQLIVNRYRKRGPLISLDEARQALELDNSAKLICLANDFQAVSQAVNLGKPLADVAPRSDFRRDVQKLTTQILALRAARSGQKPG